MRSKVVICGSFHRDLSGLQRLFKELEATGCRILSPISLDFTNLSDPVVVTNSECGLSVEELEKFHLRAMRDSDLIWLHAPAGHIGISASYELGYANALGKPVFSFNVPEDEMLQTRVIPAVSVFDGLEKAKLIV